jgi:uncharacterized protein
MADVKQGIPTPRPWGYFATGGWLVLAVVISMIFFIVVLNWLDPEASLKPGVADNDRRLLSYATTVLTPVQLAVLALAARLRHWRTTDYFGLMRPSNREIATALASVIVLSTAEATVIYFTDWRTEYNTNLYVSARAAGALPVLWLIIELVLFVPIAEEITFRGFLYRGWVRTPRTVVPGILVISALFAVTHIQYDWFGIIIVFCRGLVYGWVRWWSGSTLLVILMHAVTNLLVMIKTVADAEWLS